MQLDFRHFVMKMERIAEIKPLAYQDFVANYVKAFYIPESELEQWVKQHPVTNLPSKEPKKFSDFLFVLFSGVHFKAIGMLDQFCGIQQQQNQTKAQSNGPRDLRQNPEATVMTNF